MGIMFAVLAVLTVFFALGVVFLGRNSVHTAMFLVGTMVCIAIHYLLLAMEFIAFAQMIIYAGAIVVLFLFIIMLLNIREPDIAPRASFTRKLGAIMLALVFAFVLYQVAIEPLVIRLEPLDPVNLREPGVTTAELARVLLTRYLLPFELTSILLLVAIVGATVIGRRSAEFAGPRTLARTGRRA